MRVDEARDHDAVGGIEHFCVVQFDPCRDLGDAVALDQDVATVDVTDSGIHAQDMTASDEHALRHLDSLSLSVRSYSETELRAECYHLCRHEAMVC